MRFGDYVLDYTFGCRDGGVQWSASGFPDLLTRHMMFKGAYQMDVLSALRALVQPGDTVFDVGGHHGLMAVVAGQAARPTGLVVTFEPSPQAREYLEVHVTLNRAANVVIEPIVLSDREGELPFYLQSGDVSWNSSIVREFVDPRGEIEPILVKSATVDGYVEGTGRIPTLIKIDTEGSEPAVLRGACKTIETYLPYLILEFNPKSAEVKGTTIGEMVASLMAHSYKLVVLRRNWRGYYRFSDQEPFDESTRCTGGGDAQRDLHPRGPILGPANPVFCNLRFCSVP